MGESKKSWQCCRRGPDQYYGKPHLCPSRTLSQTASTYTKVGVAVYHSVLRLCSEFRDSRSFLWLEIIKSIQGKIPWLTKMRRDQAGTPLSRVYTRLYRLWRYKSSTIARRSMRRRCKHIFRVCLRQCAKSSLQIQSLSATNRCLHLLNK